MTFRVMAPTGLRDFFVSSVGDPFTSTQLLLPHSFLFFFLIPAQLSYSADTPAFPCLAEEICLNHGNEMFALAQSGSSISGGCFTKSPGGLFFILPEEAASRCDNRLAEKQLAV